MLHPFYEARAWRIATQIVRRAPTRLTLLESDFDDGHYIFHSIVPREASGPREALEHCLVDVNRHGTMLNRAHQPLPPELEKAMRDPALLFDRASSLYRKLAAQLGLPDPQPLPPSTPETLSFRFIVAWLQLQSAQGNSCACWQGIDAAGRVRAEYFRVFPQPDLGSLATALRIDRTRWHPGYRFWFIVVGDNSPVACIDADGLLRHLMAHLSTSA